MTKPLAIVTVTSPGLELASNLTNLISEDIDVFIPENLYKRIGLSGGKWEEKLTFFSEDLSKFLGVIFKEYRGLILIMATGIAVRALSPHLVSKYQDPAVVVVDVKGKYAISLLSGHLGGANELAYRIASLLKGEAVITTASDTQGKPSLDIVAKKLNMAVSPAKNLTSVMAAIVNGEEVDFWVEPIYEPKIKEEFAPFKFRTLTVYPSLSTNVDRAGIIVTWRRLPIPGPRWIFLRPRDIIAGIGCRKSVSHKVILKALGLTLKKAGLTFKSLKNLASVDFKAQEPGLQIVAQRLGLNLITYRPTELANCLKKHPELNHSENVSKRVGIGGVCEPASLLASGEGELLCPKMIYRGVTIALARER